jgi:hypothetical protein
MEIAQLAGVAYKYANGVLYSYVSRPEGLLKRKYKPRKPKAKAEIPIVEGPPPVKEPEPLPEGKYGKHIAPGWLWNLDGGVNTLEKKHEHLGKRKLKR